MTFAGKTSNMYRLTKEQYDQLIMNSITFTYKKANNNIKNKSTWPEKFNEGQGSNKTNGNKRRGQ